MTCVRISSVTMKCISKESLRCCCYWKVPRIKTGSPPPPPLLTVHRATIFLLCMLFISTASWHLLRHVYISKSRCDSILNEGLIIKGECVCVWSRMIWTVLLMMSLTDLKAPKYTASALQQYTCQGWQVTRWSHFFLSFFFIGSSRCCQAIIINGTIHTHTCLWHQELLQVFWRFTM